MPITSFRQVNLLGTSSSAKRQFGILGCRRPHFAAGVTRPRYGRQFSRTLWGDIIAAFFNSNHISAYPDREFHRLGLEVGVDAFLDKKDLDASALRQVIDDVIG